MSDTKTYTYADVAEHNTKKDLFVVVHEKVYNVSSFLDEHPGGEEVMLDVGGQDATEAFEDVGHSDEAREILNGLIVGDLERKEGDPKPKVHTSTAPTATQTDSSGMGLSMYILLIVGGALAYFGYTFLQQQDAAKK